jgi:hypothetical protein
MIETAKANVLEPYSYLEFLFKNLPDVQFEVHPEFLEKYLPWDPGFSLPVKMTRNRLRPFEMYFKWSLIFILTPGNLPLTLYLYVYLQLYL